MKKFNLCLFILLVFSGFVFYIGWTQRKVDPDKYGVVVSKTNGVNEKVVIPGEFNWHWQFLLPTNAKIKQFSIKPVTIKKTIKGELPSGELYTSIYNSNDNFSYYFDFEVSVTVAPQALINLMKQNIISDDEDLQKYLELSASSIAQLCADYYLNRAKEFPELSFESYRREDIIRNIQYYRDYPEVEVAGIALTASKIPDFKLYTKIQNQFLSTNVVNQPVIKTENNNTDEAAASSDELKEFVDE